MQKNYNCLLNKKEHINLSQISKTKEQKKENRRKTDRSKRKGILMVYAIEQRLPVMPYKYHPANSQS